ncbi:hypothetical protein IJD34_05140 [bacterium]|nr:hypothetical protein [bacterium]
MVINAVSTQQSIVQSRELKNKPEAQEQKEVSFWSKDWTAGNFVREKIGWDGLADWLDDKDKVCTDGKDDGKLGFGETMESFGKGLAGLVKGAMNHPIATAVTVGVGAAAVALTGGAILPVMVAAGATMGAGMIGVGAYKAATADTDAEAKQAWETIGTGTFAVGASALGAKSALNQANKAGVTSAQGAKDLSIGKALVQNFKSIPEALKVSGINTKANITTLTTGNIQEHSNVFRRQEQAIADAKDYERHWLNDRYNKMKYSKKQRYFDNILKKAGIKDVKIIKIEPDFFDRAPNGDWYTFKITRNGVDRTLEHFVLTSQTPDEVIVKALAKEMI